MRRASFAIEIRSSSFFCTKVILESEKSGESDSVANLENRAISDAFAGAGAIFGQK